MLKINKIKLLSLFSGIGAFEKALDRNGIDYELVNYCEIDKYASKSYSLIHNVSEDKNLIDVTKVNTDLLPKDLDLITYGFPCQDISIAGKQKGFSDENGERTRSGLFFEALRIIEDTKPKFAIAENVKALTSKKFEKEFKIVLDSLSKGGYNNYWQVLNAKDYGIPQNRERIFIVSIRKDIDNKQFYFPNPFKLDLRLKDLLEDNVDEKYYLKESKSYFIKHSFEEELKGNGFRFSPHIKDNANISKAITTRAGDRMDDNFILDNKVDTDDTNFVFSSKNKNLINNDNDPKCVRVFGLYDTDKVKRQAGGVYDSNGISCSLDTMQGGNRQPFIITHNIKQQVTVRKHEVDINNLKSVLKDSKNSSCLSCKDIAQKLDIPLTNVEHWFRSDNCFSIPPANVWFKLKDLLNIKDDSFDKSITEFETIDGKFDMADRVYNSQGLSPTLTSTLVPSVIGGVGEKTFGKQYTQGNRIYDSNCVSPSLQASNSGARGGSTLILDDNNTSNESDNATNYVNYRIRKLTPKECWRLMGFDDKDIDICIENNISNSQLYKQAGNSIVVNVLQYILQNLFNK